MDIEQYFKRQLEGNAQYPVFRGLRYQRGYGLGGVFRKLFRYIVPFVKEHGVPLLKTVGKTALNSATNLATDALDGKNIKESAKQRLKETFEDLKKKADMKGNGINKGRKRQLTRKVKANKKRKLDIFD
jgi:hypothetical protein